jgi:hypothetical protein
MAIFSSSTVRLLHQKLIIDGLSANGDRAAGGQTFCMMSLHSGAQPTANTVASNWGNYRSTQSSFLSLTPITITRWNTTGTASASYQTGTGIRSGTAEWAILMSVRNNANASGSGSGGVVSTATYTTSSYNFSNPPNQYFMVVPVSASTETGVIRLIDTAITAGGVFTITDISMMLGWD